MSLKRLPSTSIGALTGTPASLGSLLFLTVSLMACAPVQQSGSVPVYTPSPSGTAKPDRQKETQVEQSGPLEQVPEAEEPVYEIAPSSTAVKPAQKAVTSLIDEAWKHYHNDDPEKAIAVAERAQRLDSRSAEAYLVLASSYLIQGQQQLAEQFARRGLSYSSVGSALRNRLQQLLGRITALQ